MLVNILSCKKQTEVIINILNEYELELNNSRSQCLKDNLNFLANKPAPCGCHSYNLVF